MNELTITILTSKKRIKEAEEIFLSVLCLLYNQPHQFLYSSDVC